MAGRPSRTSSIPIPRSNTTSLPSLDDVISMPFSTSPPPLPRPRAPSGSAAPMALRSPSALAGSPPAPASRSLTSSSIYIHRPPANAGSGISPVLPRIIRGNTTNTSSSASFNHHSPSWADVACSPPSTSPARNRRPSAGATSLRPASSSRPAGGAWHAPPATQPPLNLPVPFPRPSYLEFSALRDLIQTELPPALPSGRYGSPVVWTHSRGRSREHSTATPSTEDSEDDIMSPPPPRHTGGGAGTAGTVSLDALDNTALVGSTPVFRLPTRWSEQDRHTYLSVSNDGRDLTYDGGPGFQASSNMDNAGMARTNHPVPPACGIFYYEIEIIGKAQKAHVSIGFTASDTRLTRLPGHEKNSWGYHGDDGCSYNAEKVGTSYGETFGGGDIIGAGIDFSQNRAFFTKNGALINYVFDRVAEDVEVYPSVGLRHTTEIVRVNFGHESFRYDIDDHVQQQRDTIWARTQQIAIDWRVLEPGRTTAARAVPVPIRDSHQGGGEKATSEEAELELKGREETGKLVLGYLVHHGYAKSARAFEEQLKKMTQRQRSGSTASDSPALPVPPPSVHAAPAASTSASAYGYGTDVDTPMTDASESTPTPQPHSHAGDAADAMSTALAHRLAIVQAVQKGDIDTALRETQEQFPDVLEREQGLVLLKLRCRKFVELVNEAAEMKRRVERSGHATTAASSSAVRGPGAEFDGGAADGMYRIAPMDGMNGVGTVLDGEGDADDSMEVDDAALPVPAPMSSMSGSSSTGNGANPLTTSPVVQQPFRAPLSPPLAPLPASSSSHPTYSHPHTTTSSYPSTASPSHEPSFTPSASQAAEAALKATIAYGQSLRSDYKKDPRKEVQAYLERTFGVVAYHFPAEEGGVVGLWAGQAAREGLAMEVNQAILESQGWPARPALERVYRQTAASLAQLGFLGVGAAVFADVQRELLDSPVEL